MGKILEVSPSKLEWEIQFSFSAGGERLNVIHTPVAQRREKGKRS